MTVYLPRKVHEILSAGGFKVDERIVFYHGEPVGILVPCLLFGTDAQGSITVIGPRGHSVSAVDAGNLWSIVIALGGVLLGTPDQVFELSLALKAPETSRTFSYLTCICSDCAAVLHAFKGFSSSTVAILGCGGIGSLSAALLAGAGIRSLRLVDGDLIESSNLNRQLLYTLTDVGRLKVDVTSEQIAARFPKTAVQSINEHITSETLASCCSGVDAILMTADEPLNLLHTVSNYAKSNSMKLVVVGYSVEQGLVTSAWAPGSADVGVVWERGLDSIMPSFGPTNAELAGLAVTLLFQILAGILNGEDAAQTYRYCNHKLPRRYVQNVSLGD